MAREGRGDLLLRLAIGTTKLTNLLTLIGVTGPAIVGAKLSDALTPFGAIPGVGGLLEALSDVPVKLVAELAEEIERTNKCFLRILEEQLKEKKGGK